MFPDLTTMSAGLAFTNPVANYNGHNQLFTNTNSNTLSTDGVSISPAQTIQITNVKVTEQQAFALQFWFKGSITTSSSFVALKTSGGLKTIYMTVSGTNVHVKSEENTSKTINFSGVNSNMQSSAWTFFAMSYGWAGTSNKFIM